MKHQHDLIKAHPWFRHQSIVAITPLVGGLNNTVYKVTLSNDMVVVHLSQSQSQSQSQNQPAPLALQATVAALGYAPQVLSANPAESLSITEYIDGAHRPARYWSADQLQRFTEQLARIHQLQPPLPMPVMQLNQQIDDYQQQLTLPPDEQILVDTAIARLSTLAELPDTLGICHHDLLPGNIICTKDTHYIIDWEFAAIGDVFFDLAGFMIEHQLEPIVTSTFLSAYCQQRGFTFSDEISQLKIELMKIAYLLVCWLWHKVKSQAILLAQIEKIKEIEKEEVEKVEKLEEMIAVHNTRLRDYQKQLFALLWNE